MSAKPKEYKLTEGKVYLRDTRNGKVHQYQDLLAQMGYMQKFVAGAKDPTTGGTVVPVPLTATERAAEFDRLASMTPEAREAEFAGESVEIEVQGETKPMETTKAPAPPSPPKK